MSWHKQKVVSASYHQRPMTINIPFTHRGVVLNTQEGHSWLIHHPGPTGPQKNKVVCTEASNMSKLWVKKRDIPVKEEKTVGQVMKEANGIGNNLWINYITGGTCIGVANRAEKELQREKLDYNNPEHRAKTIKMHYDAFQSIDYDPKDWFDNAPGTDLYDPTKFRK